MLGIAYIGFIWMLEAAGIRYMALCGTSSGAIVAGMIASLRNRPDEPVARRALQVSLSEAHASIVRGASHTVVRPSLRELASCEVPVAQHITAGIVRCDAALKVQPSCICVQVAFVLLLHMLRAAV